MLRKKSTNEERQTADKYSFNDLCKRVQENLFKVVIVGDQGVGKTSILARTAMETFPRHYRATIGVDFVIKRLVISNEFVRLQIWDVAGQEKHGHMIRLYFKEAIGVIITFDVTRPDSFESLADWKKIVDTCTTLPDGNPIPCILLANKVDDTRKQGIIDTPKELDEYAKKHGYVGWYGTSAKDNTSIDQALLDLSKAILTKKTLYPYVQMPSPKAAVLDEQFNLSERAELERSIRLSSPVDNKCICK